MGGVYAACILPAALLTLRAVAPIVIGARRCEHPKTRNLAITSIIFTIAIVQWFSGGRRVLLECISLEGLRLQGGKIRSLCPTAEAFEGGAIARRRFAPVSCMLASTASSVSKGIPYFAIWAGLTKVARLFVGRLCTPLGATADEGLPRPRALHRLNWHQ